MAPVYQLSKLFREFFNSERAGGLILLACTAGSLLLANSAWGEAYMHFWHRHLDLSFGWFQLDLSLEHWINDGLMAVFFLLVGLEIERELYVGELKGWSNAVFPLAAALGGMLLPAAIHFLLNKGTATQDGLGIPMATDIAFALGMLSLLGKSVPASLKVFLTALAIIDDLGAILVIAIFYSKGIDTGYLLGALGIWLLLFLFRALRLSRLLWYLLPGLLMWYCMYRSGVHATLAGVLLAFAIPFSRNADRHPSQVLQHYLHLPVAYFILPVFALANTGLLLAPGWAGSLQSSNSLGVILGLLLGKPAGILLAGFLMVRLCKKPFPDGISWAGLSGAGFLAGIGFTMSIFISNLAYSDAELVQSSKIAVLISSLLAAVLGLVILAFTSKKPDY